MCWCEVQIMNIPPKSNSLSGLRPQTFDCKAFHRSSSVEDDSYESSSDEDSVSVDYSNESQWLRWTRAEPWSLSTSLHLHFMLYSVAGLLSILSLSISVQGTIPTLSYSFTLDAEPLSRRSCLLLHPYAFQQRILKIHSMSSCLLLGRTGKTLVVCALAEEAGFWMLAIRRYGHCGFFIYKVVFSN